MGKGTKERRERGGGESKEENKEYKKERKGKVMPVKDNDCIKIKIVIRLGGGKCS